MVAQRAESEIFVDERSPLTCMQAHFPDWFPRYARTA